MRSKTTQTKGHWWHTDGFVAGICHHDESVQAFEAAEMPVLAPLFLPAPVDLHVHGGGGHDCMSSDASLRGMLKAHACHGTGALLATSVTAPYTSTTQFVDRVSRVMRDQDPSAATLLGAHLEGPFINPRKLGAQPAYASALNVNQFESWLDSGVVRVVTYAPEVDPHGEMLALCERYQVRLQIGHTLCSWAQARSALQAGCGVTHLFNAMSPLSHRSGGAVAAALAYARYAEIITDGVHVEQGAFDAARRAIPGLYSVTDATAASGMPDGEYRLGSLDVTKTGNKVVLPDGTLAGSCLTQRESISVLRQWGVDWHSIGQLTSAIPAQWIGETSFGQIGPRTKAHWIEVRNDSLVALWLSGQRYRIAAG